MRRQMFGTLVSLMFIVLFGVLTGIFLVINAGAQVPTKAQIAFSSKRDGNYEIYVMDADGKNHKNITNHPAIDWRPDWSPDGQKIAFISDRDGENEIYVMDADGKNPKNLTKHAGNDWGPDWSPDGQKITFVSNRDTGKYEIYVMDVDGKNPKRLTNDGCLNQMPSWSPDSRQIAFVGCGVDTWEIYVIDVDGKNRKNLTNHAGVEWLPAWSPDGRRIAFVSWWDGINNPEIYVMDADGKNQTRLTQNALGGDVPRDFATSGPSWSPDGRKIAFSSKRDGNLEIYVMDSDGKNPKNLTNHPADDRDPSWFDPAVLSVSFVGKRVITWGELKQNSLK